MSELHISLDGLAEVVSLEKMVRDDMISNGFMPPATMVFDGKVHRFGKENVCWYVGYDDDYPFAQYCDWSIGEYHNVHAFHNQKMTIEEQAEWKAKLEAIKAERDAEEERAHREAAERSKRIWNDTNATEERHGYIEKKGINPKSEYHVSADNRIILPIYDEDGEIVSLQFIDADGNKRFLPGGKLKGSYGYINGDGQTFLCEGWATAESIHAASGAEVFFSFSANNLKPVAEMLTRIGKPARIVADNDESGTGERYANECGIPFILIPEVGMDANDYLMSGHNLAALLRKDKGYKTADEFVGESFSMEWLIIDVIPAKSYVLVVGDPAAGKSFALLSVAFMLSQNVMDNWMNHGVKHRGAVVYVAGEGKIGLRKRIKALKKHYHQDSLENFHVIDTLEGALDTPEGQLELKARLDEIVSDNGVPISAVIIDTLNVFFEGDENSSQEIRRFNIGMQHLIDTFGCTMIVVSHTGVGANAKDRPRGSSALLAAVDVCMLVNVKDNIRTISCVKAKDFEHFEPIQSRIHDVYLGTFDEDGKEDKAGVLLALSSEELQRKKQEIADNALIQESWSIVRKTFGKYPHFREDGTPYVVTEELTKTMMISKESMPKYIRSADRKIGVLVSTGALIKVTEMDHGKQSVKELDIVDFIVATDLKITNKVTSDNYGQTTDTTELSAVDKAEDTSDTTTLIYPKGIRGVSAVRSQPQSVASDDDVPFDAVSEVGDSSGWFGGAYD